MIRRAILVWFALVPIAVANGAVREALIVPRAGEAAGGAISTASLALLILLLSGVTIGWVRPRSSRDAWTVGALWLALTLAFEFLAGHYLFGTPWSRLLEAYNLVRGRTWVLVLVTTAVAPVITARARGRI